MSVPVVVAGATGKTGREICRAVLQDQRFTLVGAVARRGRRQDLGEVLAAAEGRLGVPLWSSLEELLAEGVQPRVLVEFGVPESARPNIRTAIASGIAPVVGTTGFTHDELESFATDCRSAGIGGAFVANFALGAMLMIRFAEQARRFFPHVEVIELHHQTKLDAPSGTALRTKARLEAVGGDLGGPAVGVHSVRLPGLVAHQEVIFGGPGQVLTIRHDVFSRECYGQGVLLACRWVLETGQVAFDLDRMVQG